MYIILIGPPGCGKGTQSANIVRHLGLSHISTGEILRQVMETRSELGRRVAEYVDQGKLVPDCVIMELVAERLAEPDCRDGCLFDGFPRDLVQAEALDELLAQRDEEVTLAIEMRADEEELIRRILTRARIEGRKDDSTKTLQQRMQVYASQTAPILEYYRQAGKLHSIDALGTPEEVFQRIVALLPV